MSVTVNNLAVDKVDCHLTVVHLVICDEGCHELELIASCAGQRFSEVSVEARVESHVIYTEGVINLEVLLTLPDLLPSRKVNIFREIRLSFPFSPIRVEGLGNCERADRLLILVKLEWELGQFSESRRRPTDATSEHIRQHFVVRLEFEVIVFTGVEALGVLDLDDIIDDISCHLRD